MRVKDKLALDDLYFGVVISSSSWNNHQNPRGLTTVNLFDSSRVKSSVARWVLMSPEEKKTHDLLHWCFFDVCGRCEYEFVICPWGGLDKDDKAAEVGQKVDTWRMYVEPNAELLEDLVSRVTQSSAKRYLAEERKRYKRIRA